MKRVLRMIQCSLAGAGVGAGFHHHERFSQLALQGAMAKDSLHIFLLNNHGSYSYITAQQQDSLQQIIYLMAALWVNVVLIEVILKRFFK